MSRASAGFRGIPLVYGIRFRLGLNVIYLL
jgi:hypothetical protein